MPGKPFYFDPYASGAAVFLGPTEARLMELAWSRKSLTVKKALFFMGEKNGLAYTTVMTVLGRLADKNLLKKEKQGKSFVYRPAIDRKTFLKERMKTVTDCLKRNFKPNS